MIATTIEQSKKLLEIGIDPSTADMCYAPFDEEWKLYAEKYDAERITKEYPAWSLSALLDLLPKSEDTVIDLCFGGYKGEEYIDEWFCSFEDNKEPFEFHSYSNKDKLDAIFEMVVWLKENKKI